MLCFSTAVYSDRLFIFYPPSDLQLPFSRLGQSRFNRSRASRAEAEAPLECVSRGFDASLCEIGSIRLGIVIDFYTTSWLSPSSTASAARLAQAIPR
ncbi:hypothetical protein ACKLNR_002437 [Fusarium oxysporum f. sp. zingiberi]